MEHSETRVLWTRHIDVETQRRRRQKFLTFYVWPSSVLCVGMGVLSSWGEALGVLILLGSFGLMLGAWMWLLHFTERQNAEILLTADGQLKLGGNARVPAVPLADIRAWSTGETQQSNSLSTSRAGSTIDLSVVSFRFHETSAMTEPVRFVWGAMPAAELEGIREALEPHIEAPWVPLSEIDD